MSTFIRNILPEQKDYDRVKNIKSEARARQMANSIIDNIKLIRRTKAYIETYGPGENPFLEVLKERNLDKETIISINYPHMWKFFDKYES